MPGRSYFYDFDFRMHSGGPFAARKLLRIKVTPDLHLSCSKIGGNLGLVLKMKNIACISILLTKHENMLIYICLNLFYTVLQHLMN